MTLEEKIRLINLFVEREPETTIKDYLEALQEIERVTSSLVRWEMFQYEKEKVENLYQLKRFE